MKPDGRSLEFTVVGLGQAGGNLATEFFRRGYPALALNTAQTDLDALDPGGVYPSMPEDRRVYVGLDGYDGAGMDPAYAAECIRESTEIIRNRVLAEAEGSDALILCAGLGGGTGSALNELVHVLRDHDIPLLGLMTLPMDSESGIVKVNAVRAINELVDAPLDGWIFVDNARIAHINQDVSIVDYYAHINGRIASPLDGFNRINDREDIRSIRSFDGEDFRKLLLSGGVLSYGIVPVRELSVDEINGAIRHTLATGDLMPAGFDLDSVAYLGVIIEGSEKDLTNASIGAFESIDAGIKEMTEGAALYRGVYRTSDENAEPTVRVIASTHSLPHRIRELLSDAQREGTALRDKLQEQLPTLELGEIEDFELVKPTNRPSRAPGGRSRPPRARQMIQDLQEDIVTPKRPAAASKAKKPNRPQRPANRRKAQAAAPRGDSRAEPRRAMQEPLAVPSSKLLDTESNSEAETSEMSLIDELARDPRLPVDMDIPNDIDVPTPETYDKLVSDYLHATDDQSRIQIASRLEHDGMSPHTVIRYYAVEAMSKLGVEAFADALFSASEDENEAVRAIAVEALRR